MDDTATRPRRCVLYPVLAVPIAAGAPLGWLALRWLGRDTQAHSLAWIHGELRTWTALYLYLTISTTAVLTLIAGWLGTLSDRMKHEAITDVLTGLYNRRYLEARLVEEMSSARRYGTALSMVLIDLDHFKAINDERGHDAGDSLLRRVGRLLRAELRGSDVAARPAGDEFVALLPRTAIDDARAFGERLRASASLELDGATLSIGVASFEPDTHTSPRDLFRVADQALYRAKAAGRDAVR